MTLKNILPLFISILFLSCGNSDNSEEFIKNTSGRYLYNSDEVIEVFFQEGKLNLKWRGATKIQPMKVDDNTFFVKEMNEKIQFLMNPSDKMQYIVLVPKSESDSIVFNYKKLKTNENVPSEYLKNNEFDKALAGYLSIKSNDSLDSSINESNFNRLGYQKLGNKEFENAIQIFKINIALYPNSSNVYDSYGEALLKSGDTVQAIVSYKKSLSLDSGNSRAKRMLKKYDKK